MGEFLIAFGRTDSDGQRHFYDFYCFTGQSLNGRHACHLNKLNFSLDFYYIVMVKCSNQRSQWLYKHSMTTVLFLNLVTNAE